MEFFAASSSSSKPVVELDLIGRLEGRNYEDIEQDLRLASCLPMKTCTTCGVSRTSLWRNGPKGPKSLCNLCGLRYLEEAMRLNTNLTLGPSDFNMARRRPNRAT